MWILPMLGLKYVSRTCFWVFAAPSCDVSRWANFLLTSAGGQTGILLSLPYVDPYVYMFGTLRALG